MTLKYVLEYLEDNKVKKVSFDSLKELEFKLLDISKDCVIVNAYPQIID